MASYPQLPYYLRSLPGKHTKLLDFIANNDRLKETAKDNFANTDYALRLYNKMHGDKVMLAAELQFSIYYSPSRQQKTD